MHQLLELDNVHGDMVAATGYPVMMEMVSVVAEKMQTAVCALLKVSIMKFSCFIGMQRKQGRVT